ncbi:hypothetical protein [Parasporobacterium paucivorans]|uniref:Uncharacterized protein n=1 Tax=Parasporobacterium paucivorans DSM 15970 TaxID=1122934 RepID=A0A1M6C2C8_9FIRM|nr:hypothetical protein [Parasporobacterium paucivorans]SHI55205.1 hypothetical protein SAMN02745691_00454 [Parasporobacterium paucivorans DSM 15970]
MKKFEGHDQDDFDIDSILKDLQGETVFQGEESDEEGDLQLEIEERPPAGRNPRPPRNSDKIMNRLLVAGGAIILILLISILIGTLAGNGSVVSGTGETTAASTDAAGEQETASVEIDRPTDVEQATVSNGSTGELDTEGKTETLAETTEAASETTSETTTEPTSETTTEPITTSPTTTSPTTTSPTTAEDGSQTNKPN